MSKISVIIQREYLTRVRKKSFIVMTILAPLLMIGIIVVPTVLMTTEGQDYKKIAVVEKDSDLFRSALPSTEDAEFVYLGNVDINDLKSNFSDAGYYGVLYITPLGFNVPDIVQLISRKQPPLGLIEHISSSLEKEIERQKLLSYNIENLDQILKSIRTNVSVQTIKIDESGTVKETSTGIAMAMAYLGGFLMYMLVFIFGSQVMRGVIEEKTSRVVEVLVSSVKPVELMIGKITGIALVGLTQFLIWIAILIGSLLVVGKVLQPKEVVAAVQEAPQSILAASQIADSPVTQSVADQTPELKELLAILKTLKNQKWGLILFSFIFFFLTGYLLYASIFAAIGSAVDNETETQQFMLPVTIPIILALMIAMGTMQNPESNLAFWFSLIPLTSPIVMMARIPFEVPLWELALSMGLMIITLVFFVWMAAKIYRTGILMYGKKTSYKELYKWLTYKG
ncbi:MAG: ABC transporter permease [Bacteroidales bacterium]|jgi:ABC-2 type transport system permease protein|nr:ABC transporter permease [Bacteroidales bacterium]